MYNTNVKDNDAFDGSGNKELSVFAKERDVAQYCQLRIPMHWNKAQDNAVRFEVSVGRRQHMYRTLFFANERVTRWHKRYKRNVVTFTSSSITAEEEKNHHNCSSSTINTTKATNNE